jgi:hypothetical protein
MRSILLMLLCWALALGGHYGELAAQGRAAGPWRVVTKPIRYKRYADWGSAAEWGDKHPQSAKANTSIAVRMQRTLLRVPWNVQPAAITLFIGCQNPLLAPAVSRGRRAPVRFKATGATVRLDPKQHLLLLAPSAPVVVLWAYRGQRRVFRHEFRAVPPPPPTIKCYTRSCGATCKPAGYDEYLRTVTLRALPAIDFAAILPEDARYRVAQFRATLLRQGTAVELSPGKSAEQLIQGPQGNVSDLTSISQFGDQLQLAILLVQRQNCLGIITEAPLTQRFVVKDIRCPKPE